VLLLFQAWLLTYSATEIEPAFLACGISALKEGRIDLYRVNPPLARLAAAIPACLNSSCRDDWMDALYSQEGRPEFEVGTNFLRANGAMIFP
jgi:hypothetical protein